MKNKKINMVHRTVDSDFLSFTSSSLLAQMIELVTNFRRIKIWLFRCNDSNNEITAIQTRLETEILSEYILSLGSVVFFSFVFSKSSYEDHALP